MAENIRDILKDFTHLGTIICPFCGISMLGASFHQHVETDHVKMLNANGVELLSTGLKRWKEATEVV
jgi:hypothetical protein